MKKPTLRVTKWMGDIPIEAECTACPDQEKMKTASADHRPNKAEYQQNLQRAFDRHLVEAHTSLSANEP
jgi:nitrate/TMAO reductase-like tetraheme cytochrome c subunit